MLLVSTRIVFRLLVASVLCSNVFLRASSSSIDAPILNFATDWLSKHLSFLHGESLPSPTIELMDSESNEQTVVMAEPEPVVQYVPVYNTGSGRPVYQERVFYVPRRKVVVIDTEFKLSLKVLWEHQTEGMLYKMQVSEDSSGEIAVTACVRIQEQIRSEFYAENSVASSETPSRKRSIESVVQKSNREFPDPICIFSRDCDFDHQSVYKRLIQSSSISNIRVMSVNIWNHNHWKIRMPLLRDAILSQNPDIIGFQEVRSRKYSSAKKGRFQIADLTNLLPGFDFVYQPAMMFRESAHGMEELVHEGLAIFSKLPILSTDYIPLSRDQNDPADFHQRICLRARILTSAGPVMFMTTHLSLSERARDRTLKEIAASSASISEPSILVGDFNAGAESIYAILNEKGFLDAGAEIHPEWTQSSTGFTFSSWNPKQRIDFVFYRQGSQNHLENREMLQDLQLKPIEATITGRTSVPISGLHPKGGVQDYNGKLFPSDHFFLAVDFRVMTNDHTLNNEQPKDEL